MQSRDIELSYIKSGISIVICIRRHFEYDGRMNCTRKWLIKALIGFIFAQISLQVIAEDESLPVDVAKLFPAQRNPYAPKPKPPDQADSVNTQVSSSPSGSSPKDTNIRIDGHGSSSNGGSSGGNTVMRHRFTFD
jgi:hypothetical protein